MIRVAALSTDQVGGPSSADAGSVLVSCARDVGKWGVEVMGSSDSGLLGVRGLWNFGKDPRVAASGAREDGGRLSTSTEAADAYLVEEEIPSPVLQRSTPRNTPSRLSAGFEVYYSPLNKTGGLSTGLRFTTLTPPSLTSSSLSTALPSLETLEPTTLATSSRTPVSSNSQSLPPPPFPYTLTVTLSPLVGALSTTYSLLATPRLALSSRFDFNVYSYESEFIVGAEMWRPKSPAQKNSIRKQYQVSASREDLRWAAEKAAVWQSCSAVNRLPSGPSNPPSAIVPSDTDDDGVVKMRASSSGIRFLWVSRLSSILYSVGVQLGWDEAGGKRKGVRGVGIEVGYVS